jgi:hypothetical protein
VDDAELAREITVLREAGFGGVEIQPMIFGLAQEDITTEVRSAGTPTYFGHVRAALEAASTHDLAIDLTIGSGWPTGGPFVETGERQLLRSSLRVTGPSNYEGALPPPEEPPWTSRVSTLLDALGPFDTDATLVALVGARVVDATRSPVVVEPPFDLGEARTGDTVRWQVPEGEHLLIALYENRVHHKVVGGAYPGVAEDALVHDHLDPRGVAEVISGFLDPMAAELGTRVGAIFLDSPEMIGDLPWTTTFPATFLREAGYDIVPYLPLVFRDLGEAKYVEIVKSSGPAYHSPTLGERVREDYEDVRATLFHAQYLEPLSAWARQHGVSFRAQPHGGYAELLAAYELADIPESEGLYAGGSFDFLKLASSAAHTAGRTVVSSESFVSVTSDASLLVGSDHYRLGGRALSAGITRLMLHGYPYRHTRASGQSWYPFAAAKDTVNAGSLPITSHLAEDLPIWSELRSMNTWFARIGYAVSRGTPHSDIAWLFPDLTIRDHATINLSGSIPEDGESAVSLALKQAGLTYDRIGRQGLNAAEVQSGRLRVSEGRYAGLLITDDVAAWPGMMAALERIVDGGIPVVVLGQLPSRARGLHEHESRDAETRAQASLLAPRITSIASPDGVATAFASVGVRADIVPTDGAALTFTMNRRRVPSGELVFLFNEADETRTQTLALSEDAASIYLYDPRTGQGQAVGTRDASRRPSIALSIEAAGGRVLYIAR